MRHLGDRTSIGHLEAVSGTYSADVIAQNLITSNDVVVSGVITVAKSPNSSTPLLELAGGETGIGLRHASSDYIDFVVGGTRVAGVTPYVIDAKKFRESNSATATPGFSAIDDTNTGMHLPGGDVIHLVGGTTAIVTVSGKGDATDGMGIEGNLAVTGTITGNQGEVAGIDELLTVSGHLQTEIGSGGKLPFAHISGLITVIAADTAHDITVSGGACRDFTNTADMIVTSTITKQIDDAGGWVEGDNQPGFPDDLTLANNTWYHVFVISKTDGTVDAGFDTDSAASNLLTDASDYTYYRRVGYIRTNGSANIIGYTQFGEHFQWTDAYANGNESTGRYGFGVDLDPEFTNTIDFAPPETLVHVDAYWTGATNGFHISQVGDVSPTPATNEPATFSMGGSTDAGNMWFRIDINRQYQIEGDASCSIFMRTRAWMDDRGKNGQ